MNDAVPLQLAQGLREHFRRHALEPSLQFVRASRAGAQRTQHEHRPLAADQREDALRRAVAVVDIGPAGRFCGDI
jgi:hypothetical protein